MKRATDSTEYSASDAIMTVRGRYLRTGTGSLPAGAAGSWERRTVPAEERLEVSELGFAAASEWATTRISSGRLTSEAAKDRALLMVSDVQHKELLSSAAALNLRKPLPDRLSGGCLAENIYVTGNATAKTLCVGDVLAVATTKRRRRSAGQSSRDGGDDADGLRLQVSSPCQPCSKVDQRLGQTWGGHGVRALCARMGSRGWFVRVLHPGHLDDGDVLTVVERPNPTWPLARVADLLYNMEGVCDKPGGYCFPTGRDVAAKWRGTQAELRELANLPELAGFEWRDEARKMLDAWDAADARRSCVIL